MMAVILVSTSVAADTEIHRCLLEDGTIAFQEKPCPEIDVIDFEMRENAYTKEQGQDYLAELLSLTRQLRACKQL